jgi:hypothetical protein
MGSKTNNNIMATKKYKGDGEVGEVEKNLGRKF